VSATNRGAERVANDFYGTPAWATRAILKRLISRGLRINGTVLEPGCGDGAIMRELVEQGWHSRQITGVEVDEQRAARAMVAGFNVLVGDLLKPGELALSKYDLVIGNPPYKLAEAFVMSALARTEYCAVQLLRLNWAEAKCRAAFHQNFPGHLHVLTKRPSFGLNKHGKKGTDATAYAWWQWGGPGYVPGRWEILQVE